MNHARTTHLDALRLRLSNTRARLATQTTTTGRRAFAVLVAQCEREVAGEIAFLRANHDAIYAGTDDDLLAELLA
jgi:hypothetical protein